MNKFTLALVVGAATVIAAPSVASAQPAEHTVSGTFVNDCGDGGAWIELRDASGTRVDSQNTPDGGTFAFDEVADGDYTVFPYAPAGCGPMPYPGGAHLTVDGGDVTDLSVGLVAVHSIWGTVTGCDAGEGNPLNGATVDLDIDTEFLTYDASYTSGAWRDGVFFFQNLPATDGYTLTVTPPEGCRIEEPVIEVDLTDDDVEVEFALEQIPEPEPEPAGSLGSLGSVGPFGSAVSFGSGASFASAGSLGALESAGGTIS